MKPASTIFLTAVLSLLNASAALAESAATVEGLQMPAWVERSGNRLAMKVGMDLQSGDKVITGANAKALLRLEEGSDVKIGQNARIHLDKLSPPVQEDGLFSGLLNVVKGAFRFTTSKLGASRQRSVDIKIGTVTAGIRGTDIWGKSNDEKDIVCLIEGKISVASNGDEFTMSDPLSFYIKPKNAPAGPVEPIDAEKLARWAKQTDLLDGDGVVKSEGKYFINMMSVSDQQLAESNQQHFHKAGFAADIEATDIDGKQWYRLRINGLASRADAERLASALEEKFNLGTAWIGRV